jgi:hypothetical protein
MFCFCGPVVVQSGGLGANVCREGDGVSKREAEREIRPREKPDSWLHRAWAWLRERPAYLLLTIGVVLYALVLVGQAMRSDVPPALNRTAPIKADGVTLFVTHPKKLVRDGPDEARQVLSAWLIYTHTVSPTSAPYVVTFEPVTGGVAFVNQRGAPVAPKLVLTPTIQSATPGTLYLRQVALVKDEASPVRLTAHLFDPGGRGLIPDGVELTVHLETGWGAFWRHLGERLLSPTTPLLTLAAGLVALAVQEYRRAEERRLKAEQKRVEEEKRSARDAQLAEIEQIHLLIPYQLDKAVKHYGEYKRRSETLSEWQADEVVAGLKSVWYAVNQHNWQRAILSQAATLLQEQQYLAVGEMVALVQSQEPDSRDARDLGLVIELAQACGEGKDHVVSIVEQYGVEKVISALQTVGQRYEPQLGDLTTRLLGHLRRNPDYADKVQNLLGEKQSGRELLRRADWPLLWSSARPTDSGVVGRWSSQVGLNFNPFGSEAAELDSRLPWYVIDSIYQKARGACPLVVTGESGAGKTTAALMLAYDCGHPPANPRETGTFPVYYPLRLVTALAEDASTVLSPLVRATAREILRYLWLQPGGLLDLPPFSQDAVRLFLTLAYSDSESLLAAEVGRLSRELQRILAPISPSKDWLHSPRLRDDDWLDLFPEALPAGFRRYEWLVDVPGRVSARLPDELPGFLSRLLDLAVPLTLVGVHLKLFVSSEVAGILDPPAGLEMVHLTWQEKDLELMLGQRIRQAGSGSLMALCGPGVALDFEKRFVQAARGSPRRLVRLGNALFTQAANHTADSPQLTESDWDAALASVQERETVLEPGATKQRYLTRLRQVLATHFDEDELRTLCFDLEIDYDDLAARGKANKARELVEHLERRDLIPDLVRIGKQFRPQVCWDDTP